MEVTRISGSHCGSLTSYYYIYKLFIAERGEVKANKQENKTYETQTILKER